MWRRNSCLHPPRPKPTALPKSTAEMINEIFYERILISKITVEIVENRMNLM